MSKPKKKAPKKKTTKDSAQIALSVVEQAIGGKLAPSAAKRR